MPHIDVIVDGLSVFKTHESLSTYNNAPIRDAEDIIPHLDHIRRSSQESFVVITVNGANEVIASRVITKGLLDCNNVHAREVFRSAILDSAAAIFIAHNHPGNTLEASPEDIAITRRLGKAAEIIGIRLIDHIIVTASGFVSMKQRGQM